MKRYLPCRKKRLCKTKRKPLAEPGIAAGIQKQFTTDQHHLIVDDKIMEAQKDAAQTEPLKQRIQKNYTDKEIISHSFDKGFWSKDNLIALQQDYTQQPVLPKRGKFTKEDTEREG